MCASPGAGAHQTLVLLATGTELRSHFQCFKLCTAPTRWELLGDKLVLLLLGQALILFVRVCIHTTSEMTL